MKTRPKTIMITGTSTGIGYAAAEAFLKAGYRVFGSVRKEEDAQRVKKTLGENFSPVMMDVCKPDEVAKAAQQIGEQLDGEGLGGLINNSGIAIGGPLMHMEMEVIKQQFEVNVFGFLEVTKALLPLLGARPDHPSLPGRVLNISSVSGKMAAPFLGPYAGTKHAMEALSTSMRRELIPYGIDVIVIGPGAVRTPIWDKGVDAEPYRNTLFYKPMLKFIELFVEEGKKGLPAPFLADKLLAIMEHRKPKARYTYVPGSKLKNWTLPLLIPPRNMDRFFSKILKLEKLGE